MCSTSKSSPFAGALRLAAIVCLVAATARGAVVVTGTATPLGGSFRYDLTVANSGPEDFVLVSLVDAPLADPLIGVTLTVPAGFLGSYDSGLGFVDFLEGADLFAAGTTVTGFGFESLAGPAGAFTAFEALGVNGENASGPVTIVTVPEPSDSPVAFALGLGLAAAAGRRNRPPSTPVAQ